MSTSIVARRYANAYFGLATEAGAIPSWRDELNRALDVLSNDEVRTALRNPRLPLVDRTQLALQLCDGVAQPARNLVRLLIERGRIAVLGEVLEQYDVLADEAAGVVRAEVITAVPVTPAIEETIASQLKKRFGESLSVRIHQDQSIIGGLIIRLGDRVIDNSVRTHLQQLHARLA